MKILYNNIRHFFLLIIVNKNYGRCGRSTKIQHGVCIVVIKNDAQLIFSMENWIQVLKTCQSTILLN